MTTPECEHYLVVESVTEPEEKAKAPHRRTIHAVCNICGYTQDVITTKTDEEIVADLAAQGRTLPDEEAPA